VQRAETKSRARALQLLYAWELQGRPPMQQVAEDALSWSGGRIRFFDAAERIAESVALAIAHLDHEISLAADNWRWDRIGVIEKNILRLALFELEEGEVPPRVTISEAVKLAHWFAGSSAPSFVNGVLDGLARDRGFL
jgi:N utilization substance protein B